ncbi:hypothetical protein nbrc107697_04850 [Gordonia crocea]|uniref:Uncharacterized protein n=1 Tax=Gordonia crocea TaxID=589162 RepID=A0A7M3SUX2_9ACTN|nr:hypothetical protein nbrc107697_04850 [Gordonia crocea]
MAGQRSCDATVIAGRMSKANEFFDAADHLGEEMPNAAGDLYVDAGIAAADVLCCVRLGVHSNWNKKSPASSMRDFSECARRDSNPKPSDHERVF